MWRPLPIPNVLLFLLLRTFCGLTSDTVGGATARALAIIGKKKGRIPRMKQPNSQS
nr:hypothetical protein [Candidatus Njordarchaeota archaeon]